jgi:hypothetical protein
MKSKIRFSRLATATMNRYVVPAQVFMKLSEGDKTTWIG